MKASEQRVSDLQHMRKGNSSNINAGTVPGVSKTVCHRLTIQVHVLHKSACPAGCSVKQQVTAHNQTLGAPMSCFEQSFSSTFASSSRQACPWLTMAGFWTMWYPVTASTLPRQQTGRSVSSRQTTSHVG